MYKQVGVLLVVIVACATAQSVCRCASGWTQCIRRQNAAMQRNITNCEATCKTRVQASRPAARAAIDCMTAQMRADFATWNAFDTCLTGQFGGNYPGCSVDGQTGTPYEQQFTDYFNQQFEAASTGGGWDDGDYPDNPALEAREEAWYTQVEAAFADTGLNEFDSCMDSCMGWDTMEGDMEELEEDEAVRNCAAEQRCTAHFTDLTRLDAAVNSCDTTNAAAMSEDKWFTDVCRCASLSSATARQQCPTLVRDRAQLTQEWTRLFPTTRAHSRMSHRHKRSLKRR